MDALFTEAERQQLLSNWREAARVGKIDPFPVVKLYMLDDNAAWLLTSMNPTEEFVFGLCDLGIGNPKLGTISVAELKGFRGKAGLPPERDPHFRPTDALSVYAERARKARRIVPMTIGRSVLETWSFYDPGARGRVVVDTHGSGQES